MKDEEMAENWIAEYTGVDVETQKAIQLQYHKNLKQAFLAGLKAGRPQWHKVADGDLPKDKEYVLVLTDLNNYYVAEKVDNHFMSKGWGFIPMSSVIAWCEIPTFDKE